MCKFWWCMVSVVMFSMADETYRNSLRRYVNHDPSLETAATDVAASNPPAQKLDASSSSNPGKPPAVATENLPTSPVSKGPVVESPRSMSASTGQGVAYPTDYSAHLSSHEARAFPGIFTRGKRSGSIRKEDGTRDAQEGGNI